MRFPPLGAGDAKLSDGSNGVDNLAVGIFRLVKSLRIQPFLWEKVRQRQDLVASAVLNAGVERNRPTMPAGSILLVDDDVELLKALTKVLEKQGYTVVAYPDANQALHYLEQNKPRLDLVISDISMPGMKGTTFLNALRTAYPRLPVILITAFGTWGQYAEAIRDGAFEYLSKPLDKAELLAAVQRALALPSANSAATNHKP